MAVRSHFKWRGRSLFEGNKDTGYKIQNEVVEVFDKFYASNRYYEMWRVVWPDGVTSDDYYNKTRAKDHAELEYDRSTRPEGDPIP